MRLHLGTAAVLAAASFIMAAGSTWAADPGPRLMALTATSQGTGSADLSCVLTEGCSGYWTPGTPDHGLNEGVYLQFEEPQDLTRIDVVADAPLIISVNGERAAADAKQGAGRETWSAQWDESMPVKSVFIGIDQTDAVSTPFRLYSIAFFGAGSGPQRLHVVPPSLVKATVRASSVLEPTTAYAPANLFDSRYDFAWSTDGKKDDGVGESVSVLFDAPQDVAAVIFWNGYQRSDAHYDANGRVESLEVSDDQGHVQRIQLKDQMDPQEIELDPALKGTKAVQFKITGIYPGKKYPDVLLSEMRFVDASGRLMLPNVPHERPKASAELAGRLDRSFSSGICAVSAKGSRSSDLDFKLRSDGSFVAYRNSAGSDTEEHRVWEGNWEELGPKVRLFGKRYSNQPDDHQMAYGLPEHHQAAEIFQADVKFAPFRSLSPAEQADFVARLIRSRGMQDASGFVVRGAGKHGPAKVAVTAATLNDAIVGLLRSSDAMVMDSALFSDALVPSDGGLCQD